VNPDRILGQPLGDLLGGVSLHGHFDVVNGQRPAGGEGVHEPAIHQVDDQAAQPDLDGMGAHPEDHRSPPGDRGGPGVGQLLDVASLQDRRDQVLKGPAGG